MPIGGVAGQVPVKQSATDHDIAWGNADTIRGATAAQGGDATVLGGTSTTAANPGGAALVVGANSDSGTGGAALLRGGLSGGTGTPPQIAAGGNTPTKGGSLSLNAGSSGQGGDVSVQAGASAASAGGTFSLSAGAGGGSGEGGAMTLTAGPGGATGAGGGVAISGGPGGGGTTTNSGAGGAVSLAGGQGAGADPGGDVVLSGGEGGSTGAPGSVILNGTLQALLVAAVGGFTYIPTMAGKPTGTPSAKAGNVPIVYDTTNSCLWIYTGGAWRASAVRAPLTVAYAASVALDCSLADTFDLTLTGNTTLTLTGGVDGQKVMLRVRQDATGSRLMTFGAGIDFSTDAPSVALSTAASALDLIGFQYDAAGSRYLVTSYNRGF